MGWFSSSTEKPVTERFPNNIDVTSQRGSGAEQDRYGQHFSIPSEKVERGIDKVKEASERGYDRLKDASERGYEKVQQAGKNAVNYQGAGAEQDRYAAYFSPYLHNMDARTVKAVAASIAVQGSQASFRGLGYDGQQRAKLMAGSGTGAEQERLGAHFGLTKDAVAAAAQKLKEGAQKLEDGAHDALYRR